MLRRRWGDRVVLAIGVVLFVFGLVLAGLSPSGASIWPSMVPVIMGSSAIASTLGRRLRRHKQEQAPQVPTYNRMEDSDDEAV